jgi:hypothetical protein
MRLRGVHGKPGDALSHMPLRDIPRRGHITEGPRSQPGWHGPLQPEPVRSGTERLAGVRQDRMQFARRAHDDSGDAQPQGRHLVMRWDDHIDIYPHVLGGGDGKPRWWPVFREHLRLAIDRYRDWKGDAFDRAIADFSAAYADQNERDYKAFTAAVNSGRLTAQTGV